MSAGVTVRVGLGSCGLAAGAEAVHAAVRAAVPALGVEAVVETVGCLGLCHREPMVEVEVDGSACWYGDVRPELVPRLLTTHLREGRWLEGHVVHDPARGRPSPLLGRQARVVLRDCGQVDPTSIDAYRARGGFAGLERALALGPGAVRDQVLKAGLRGRGGAGYPTGRKWAQAAAAADPVRFVVCNADEGDPGAFMDRGVLESDPFAVLEGLMIAGFAVGAREGLVYVRHEYPLARRRIGAAVDAARARGWLGGAVAGSGFAFDVKIRRGAGAFVCGEETALIASLSGQRGEPRPRPPYPVESGLDGHPTCINNVETLATVPWILVHGPQAFRALGTSSSPGTKVFCLAGDVRHGGMVEVPMGTTLGALVFDLGGGSPSGARIKAVQIGGPSGGCVPAHLFDTSVDYEALAGVGAMMGSGGLVVLDEGQCMVDVARYFTRFLRDESCGKCTACREGTARMAAILDRICAGDATVEDLGRLEALCGHVRTGSLCGLGKTAPNPVASTLRWFRAEYEAHVRDHRCPAGRCRALRRYSIDRATCDGCGVCHRACPTDAVRLDRAVIPLSIEEARCVGCDACRQVCPFDAVRVAS